MAKRRRWCVVCPKDRTYVSREGGGVAWTRDEEEARRIAQAVGGDAIDADWFAANWHHWTRTGAAPESKRLPVTEG